MRFISIFVLIVLLLSNVNVFSKEYKIYNISSKIITLKTKSNKLIKVRCIVSWKYVNGERFFTDMNKMYVEAVGDRSMVYYLYRDDDMKLTDFISDEVIDNPIFLVLDNNGSYKLMYGIQGAKQSFTLNYKEYTKFKKAIQESMVSINDLNKTFIGPSVNKLLNRDKNIRQDN